ncbi:MFS transporter [Streptomyces sp. NPDC094038]|uniref:MFS transporter n=1 Tax=Streptomyces sp. NPDC094038 TaxID=3366055 RepID=UPI0037F1EED4
MLAAFAFNTTENLPIGLLRSISADLRVSLPAVGLLVTGYGVTVAATSLPVAQVTRAIPRRHLLTGLLAVFALASWAPLAIGRSYPGLLAARIATALAQALFWAVSGPVAVGLFPPSRRGRIIGLVSVGGSLAQVLGVPAGTWLGAGWGWHTPFLVLGGAGLVALAVVAALLPTTVPGQGHAARGTAPDARRFTAVLAATALSATGVFTGFTYLTAFLTGTGRFPDAAVSVLLTVYGGAGFVAVVLAGTVLDRCPRAVPALLAAGQTAGLWGLYASGGHGRAVTVGALVLLGVSTGPFFMATQNLVFRTVPGRTELGLAGNSAAFNVGVAAGASAGGLLLHTVGVRGLFLVGGLVTALALAVLLVPVGRSKRAVTGADGSERWPEDRQE